MGTCSSNLAQPKDSSVNRVNQGKILCSQGKFAEAIIEFTAALSLNLQETAGFNYRRRSRSEQFDFAAADAHFQSALNSNLKRSEIFNMRGQAYENLNNVAAAFKDYKEAARLNPQNQNAVDNCNRMPAPSAEPQEQREEKDSSFKPG